MGCGAAAGTRVFEIPPSAICINNKSHKSCVLQRGIRTRTLPKTKASNSLHAPGLQQQEQQPQLQTRLPTKPSDGSMWVESDQGNDQPEDSNHPGSLGNNNVCVSQYGIQRRTVTKGKTFNSLYDSGLQQQPQAQQQLRLHTRPREGSVLMEDHGDHSPEDLNHPGSLRTEDETTHQHGIRRRTMPKGKSFNSLQTSGLHQQEQHNRQVSLVESLNDDLDHGQVPFSEEHLLQFGSFAAHYNRSDFPSGFQPPSNGISHHGWLHRFDHWLNSSTEHPAALEERVAHLRLLRAMSNLSSPAV
ncbi:unnamed protein product [Polarella glacialis]|uniref:Uncharacterized protein n=1 Tax=Polarella glacialis TaxID=89957 RepID=A0A813KBS9_POLGL|nr:unnamed protein product [Polarella glacialis]